MFYFFIYHVIQCLIIYKLLGANSLKFHFVHAAAGLFFLIFANYITHYGLERRKDKNGFYETINKYHSWNFVSSNIFWGIPRHSDHHNASFRPYQILRRMDEAPWIPYQMTVCLFLTICPPLWKWAINPRARAANDFNAGKPHTEVTFNYIQKKTAHDIFTNRVVYAYFFCWILFFGYLAFVSDVCIIKPWLQEPVAGII